MAKNAVYDWDATAANNLDIASISLAENVTKPSDVNNFERTHLAQVKTFALDLGAANTVTGTGDAPTIQLASNVTALVDGMRFVFSASAANTTTVVATIKNSAGLTLGTPNIKKWVAGVATNLSAGDIPGANALVEVFYDLAVTTLFIAGTSVAAATTSASGIVNLSQLSGPVNLALAASVGSSALTVALKGVDGNDPSAANPVYIPFRNVTAATGTPTWLAITAATSIVISAGSTLGMTSGVAATLAIVAFNDAGTFRMGLINPLLLPIADGIASSTAEGGAGAADSAGVFYTGTAVVSKAMTVIGYATVTEATAGTWATAPATLKVAGDAALDNVLPIVTPWVAYTPTFTGFGTATNISIWSRRCGGSLEIRGKFTTGTSTATEARLALGFNGTSGNVSADSIKVSGIQVAGYTASASTTVIFVPLIESGVAYLTWSREDNGQTGLTKLNGDTGFGSAVTVSFFAAVPISGW
jgi:hypothetical protein